MKKSIFNQTCPEISDTFDRVPASKILIVPLDFAKSKHVALFCNGNGDQLLKPFTVHNNKEGLDYLLEQIKTTCKRLAIKPQNVIVGGEDCPTFALAMLWQIEQNTRHLVIRVNAWKAKTNRDNMQASTDKLDLLGIGKTMINREAYRVFPDSEELTQFDYGDIDGTRETSRCRDALVESRTAVTNRIHSVVKVLFPGFLTKDRSGIYPFTNACLTLMAEDDFSAACYARKKTEVLAKRLASLSLTKPHEKADEIIKLANQALSPPPAIIDARRACLQALVVTYRAISESCDSMEKTAAKALARHPGAFLSTIPGYGIITACAVSGEQGHPASMRRLSSMCSYAGIVPSVKQTGGPDSPAKTGSVKRRCNRRLKNHIVRTARTMGNRNGPPEFREAYRQCQENGQHADFVMARRTLGSIKFLVQHQTIYYPPHLRNPSGMDRQKLFEYLKIQWPKIVVKWKNVGIADLAFAEDQPLGIWRKTIQDLYHIKLPITWSATVELLVPTDT